MARKTGAQSAEEAGADGEKVDEGCCHMERGSGSVRMGLAASDMRSGPHGGNTIVVGA